MNEPQFPPISVYLAKDDAEWLARWAPDPKALGSHAMGLAALRGLLAEDMPRDGQPLGGEIQHARALIENARAHPSPQPDPFMRLDHVENQTARSLPKLADARERIKALEKEVVIMEKVLIAADNNDTHQRNRITALESNLATATDNGATFRKRVAALLGAMYHPEPGDLVDVIDRADDTIIRTATANHLLRDGVALSYEDPTSVPRPSDDVIKWGDPARYILPHVEAAS